MVETVLRWPPALLLAGVAVPTPVGGRPCGGPLGVVDLGLGGPGLAPSANLNPDEPTLPALFEPVHGSAPDIAGQNLADPRATLMSLAMLLDSLAHHHPAIGNAAQHLHDLIQADLAREADGEAFPGTRETGQRLCQWLSA